MMKRTIRQRRMELTIPQRRVYDAVQRFIDENGYPPSTRELGVMCGRVPSTILAHLKALERVGLIRRKQGSARSIVLIEEDEDGNG